MPGSPKQLEAKCSAIAGCLDLILHDVAGLGDRMRDECWNGERFFLTYAWGVDREPPVALLRLQIYPVENQIWIGHVEVHPDYRGRGVGTRLIGSIEKAAIQADVEGLRLFSRSPATGFWKKLGFTPEHDPRFIKKDTNFSSLQ